MFLGILRWNSLQPTLVFRLLYIKMNQKNLDALNAMQPQSVDDLNIVEVLDVEFGIKAENNNGTIKIVDGSSMPSDAGISTAKENLLAKYQNNFYIDFTKQFIFYSDNDEYDKYENKNYIISFCFTSYAKCFM